MSSGPAKKILSSDLFFNFISLSLSGDRLPVLQPTVVGVLKTSTPRSTLRYAHVNLQ